MWFFWQVGALVIYRPTLTFQLPVAGKKPGESAADALKLK